MEWIIEIIEQNNQLAFDTHEINLPIKKINRSKLYYISGDLTKEKIEKSIHLLFQDQVTEKHKIHKMPLSMKNTRSNRSIKADNWEVEVFYKKEVTDPATSYILKALKDINISADNVRTGFRYVIKGSLKTEEVHLFSRRYLANLIVQDIYIKKIK